MPYVVARFASRGTARRFHRDRPGVARHGRMAEEKPIVCVVSMRCSLLRGMSFNRVFVPPANEAYAYDADGNQTLVTTGTGAWQVEYNGENRPVRWTCGDKTILMTFDHQGRRRLYVEVAAGVTNKLHHFTYDDYVCVARNRGVDVAMGAGDDAFVCDPTEPIATRPLMCNPSTASPILYCHDGNKNVSEAVTLDGTIAAHYEYSSFGKVVLVTSENDDQSTANLNPYRFSSEYADDALGLVYYNYRHYNPQDGRWAQRDQIAEVTGDNSTVSSLYNFVDNNPISLTDVVGFFKNPNWPPVTPSRIKPKHLPSSPVLIVASLALDVAAQYYDNAMHSCDGPCIRMGDCISCCNNIADIAMAAATLAYGVGCAGCIGAGHPLLVATCLAVAAAIYHDQVNEILQAQSDCLKSCWDNPL